ncbi:protein FAR1-RELATED SEQUENCE 1-like [Chenopodium quinoa]|uniref:protein FAR1-RELATED SEQUENCE 1-like n=1 Tax=Chenopodium quinoa TaxID=63459 RepID=UPI000B77E85A|nr:protein FAR1-RELATED SEQUENCE 1-like [Chenopodium quinoa]
MYNHVLKEVTCECRKFETHGIICKHCIRVLDQNMVFKIPTKYMLDRWRKDIVRKHTRVKVAYHDPTQTPEVKKFNMMMNAFEGVCEDASAVDDETVQLVIDSLSTLHIEVKDRSLKYMKLIASSDYPMVEDPHSDIGSNSHTVNGQSLPSPSTVPNVLDPTCKKRRRGIPKGSRNKAYLETAYKQVKPRKSKAKQGLEYAQLQDDDNIHLTQPNVGGDSVLLAQSIL